MIGMMSDIICTGREGRLIVNPVILPGQQRELYRHYDAAELSEEALVQA
jgi:hypothetical protein